MPIDTVGDTITWSFPTREVHTLTFLQPGQARPNAFTAPVTPDGSTFDGKEFLNSGVLVDGATYSVKFGAAGDFPFVCLIHAEMSGTRHVQPTERFIVTFNAPGTHEYYCALHRDLGMRGTIVVS